jgi:hypothetical protein
MTVWFIPYSVSAAEHGKCLSRKELVIAARAAPFDPSRADTQAQIQTWLGQAFPDMPPEERVAEAENLWRIAHDITPDDYLVVPTGNHSGVMLGEVLGTYQYRNEDGQSFHAWRVHWILPFIALTNAPEIQPYLGRTRVAEMPGDEISRLRQHIPRLRRSGFTIFKWISVILLVFELIYFWPH